MSEQETGTLILESTSGSEAFAVRAVETYIGDVLSSGEVLLNLELTCDSGASGAVRPSLDIWVPVPRARLVSLGGTSTHVPWSYLEEGDASNSFYYREHTDVWSIDVEFLDAFEGSYRLSLRAITHDPRDLLGDTTCRLVVEAAFRLPGVR